MFPEGNVPGYVCNPGSPRERDAASQGHTSGIPTRALLHSWKLAPAAHHGLLSILVVTSPAPDVWLSILTDYTYDSELDIADGVPLAFRRSVSFPRGTRVTYVTWDVLQQSTSITLGFWQVQTHYSHFWVITQRYWVRKSLLCWIFTTL